MGCFVQDLFVDLIICATMVTLTNSYGQHWCCGRLRCRRSATGSRGLRSEPWVGVRLKIHVRRVRIGCSGFSGFLLPFKKNKTMVVDGLQTQLPVVMS